MIVREEQIADYLLRTEGWKDEVSEKTRVKLEKWKKERHLRGLSPIEHIFIEHQTGKSLREIGGEIDLTSSTLAKLLRGYNLPILKQAEAVRKNWEDPEFRKRHAEGVRKGRKSNIPKISSYRGDINKNVGNSGVANLIRAVRYTGRQELEERSYKISLPNNGGKKIEKLDTITLDPRGNRVAYKILPRPQQRSYIRAELIEEQYGIKVRIITEEKYNRMERWFKSKIEKDERFSGWETSEDNLETNPEKYGRRTQN